MLDVEMEQIAGSGVLVANYGHGGFQVADAIQVQTAEKAADGGAAQLGCGASFPAVIDVTSEKSECRLKRIVLLVPLCRSQQTCSEPRLEEGSNQRPSGSGAWRRGKESSDAEGPEEEAKQREYQPNDKRTTYSAAKGPSQVPYPLCLMRHLLECDNTA